MSLTFYTFLAKGLTLRGVFQMVDTPAHSHWQSSETTTVTHISFKPPRTAFPSAWGQPYVSALAIVPQHPPAKAAADYYVGTGS